MEFILGNKSSRSTGCIFCVKPKEDRDRENYILFRGEHSFVMLNIYPYNNGHLLVSPYLHTGELSRLSRPVLADLMETVKKSAAVLESAVFPDGFNIGMNLGKTAGAGIENHLHIHIVPRWAGDTNYMPVLSETRVIPEHLNATYDGLLPHFRNLNASIRPAGGRRAGGKRRPAAAGRTAARKKGSRHKAGSR
jgi:ATP adenylyltransferase